MNTIPKDKLCDYGCNQPATVYFETANKYGCQKNIHCCPGYKLKRTSEKTKQFLREREELLDKISRGELNCIYCGKPAKGLVLLKNLPICDIRQQRCSEYKRMAGSKISKSLKQAYQERPEMIEKQKEIGKDVHRRPSVVLKKTKAMRNLHKQPEFVRKYRNGLQKYYDTKNSILYNKLHAAAKILFGHGVCEICGITEEEARIKYTKGLHMHCLSDMHIMKKDNWKNLCGSCHAIIHAMTRRLVKQGGKSDEQTK